METVHDAPLRLQHVATSAWGLRRCTKYIVVLLSSKSRSLSSM